MHTRMLALFEPDTPDIEAELEKRLAPFHIEKEVAPYKKYIDAAHLKLWSDTHKTGSDLYALRDKLRALGNTREIDIDAHGLYEITTFNSHGHWDYWTYGEDLLEKNHAGLGAFFGQHRQRWGDELCRHLCPLALLPADIQPGAILTSDGQWHDLMDHGWRMTNQQYAPEKNAEPLAQWKKKVSALFKQYNHTLALLLDCHS